MQYVRIARALCAGPWALRPEKLEAIADFIDCAMLGGQIPEYDAARGTSDERHGSVQVLPVFGTIAQRMNLMNDFSGGVSTEKLGKQLREAAADESISAIVLDIDSPGGSVFGIEELATEIRAARDRKPVVAVANSTAASAAYWLASQASELVIAPGAMVGSIGVVMMHVDQSAFNETAGFKPTYIHAGDHKAEGNPHEPLADETREYLQAQCDLYYQRFIKAVATGRAVSTKQVLDTFGQGRMSIDQQAVELGMADRVDTLRGTVSRLMEPRNRNKLMRARLELAELA